MTDTSEYVATFTEQYIQTLLWSETDDNGEPLDDTYSEHDLSASALRAIEDDCYDFVTDNAEDVFALDASQAGHDFCLTRNRHGAGFWDRGLGDLGDRLTVAAHVYGEQSVYVGFNSGLLYV